MDTESRYTGHLRLEIEMQCGDVIAIEAGVGLYNLGQTLPNLLGSGGAAAENEAGIAAQDATATRGTLSLGQTRAWYNQMVQTIDSEGQPTRELAQKVFDQRNVIRQQARDLMANSEAAAELAQKYPLQNFQYYVDKYSSQGYSGEGLWRRIIEGAQTTNKAVNQQFSLK
jgi:hypothetical protein